MKAQDSRMFLFLPMLAVLCLGPGASTSAEELNPDACEQDYFVDKDKKVYQENNCQGPLPFVNIGVPACTLSFFPCEQGDGLPEKIADKKSPKCPAKDYFEKQSNDPKVAIFKYKGCTEVPIQIWQFDFGSSPAAGIDGSPAVVIDEEPPELGNGPGAPNENEKKGKDKDEGGNGDL